MPKKKVEVYDKDKLIYPFIENDHVTFSNGMKVSEMLDQSISMPTVTHDETSFKVGVGDSDVSSSIVDSSVSKMVIKGQTYQNILPEPTLRNEMQGKSMQRLNEGYDNIEVVDGVSKSAILSGQTLVNYFPEYTKTMAIGTGNWRTIFNGRINIPLTPNTSYLFINNSNIGKKIHVSVIGETTAEKNVIANLTTNITKFTTPNTTDNFPRMNVYLMEDNTSELTYDSFMVIPYQDSMENWDIPYFTGMQSVKMPVLHAVGKNLFDSEKAQSGYLGGDPYGINRADHSNKTSDYIRVKPNTSYTYSLNGFTASQVGSEYWTGWYYYTSPTEVSKKNMNRQVSRGSADTFKTVTFTTPSDCYYVRIGSRGLALDGATVQLEEGSTATSYEPHKSNILRTPEEVVLKGLPNGVADTLNVNTGEYVQRTGKIILNGSEEWAMDNEASDSKENTSIFYSQKFTQFKKLEVNERNSGIVCNGYPVKGDVYGSDVEGMMFNHVNVFYFRVKKSVANNVGDFKQWLSQNPKEVQLELATPSIKTVDLSTSGNWEKIVLDGKSSENWQQNSHSGNFVQFEGYSNFCLYSTGLPLANRGLLCDSLDYYNYDAGFRYKEIEGISDGGGYRLIFVRIKTEKLPTNDVAGFKQWLSQNPIEVSYMLSSNRDSTQVKQPIFFADGHIIQSSGADNSLIPTLDYQAKTSNSYVMDLMKTNTLYTMKAKTVSGTFTIDGTSYNVNANGTFTSPSSMTDKLLIMSNKTNEEVMLLEGNVIDKTIPYFKGIKSAFEGEDKIEVLSCGANITHRILGGILESDEYNFMNILGEYKNTNGALNRAKVIKWVGEDKFFIKGYGIDQFDNQYNINLVPTVLRPNTTYSFYFESIEGSHEQNESMKLDFSSFEIFVNETRVARATESGHYTFITPNQINSIRFNLWLGGEKDKNATVYAIFNKFIIVEGMSSNYQFEPHKSNTTKIPLLHPLRSLPNGVCDELIIDRLNHKAKLIQRVGVGVLDGTHALSQVESEVDTKLYQPFHAGGSSGLFGNMATVANNKVHMWCSRLLCTPTNNPPYRRLTENSIYQYSDTSARLAGVITKKDLAGKTVTQYFRDNPTTVYYQIEAPIITEIDLEGYPYAYKDGHIFLNSDIAPTTQITYSINQAQQIESANENLQRHEKELTYLQKLIAQYVQVNYESTLLSLKI